MNGRPFIEILAWKGKINAGGIARMELTELTNALKLGENILYKLPVTWGEIIKTDGKTFLQN